MIACDFPAVRFHASEHWNFIRTIQRLRRSQEGKPNRAMVRELRDYLSDWLLHHILIQDMAIRPYISDVDSIDAYARAAAPNLQAVEAACALARA